MVVVNLNDPCRVLCPEILDGIIKKQGNRWEIWCGDFNAHNNLLGSKHTDSNGEAVEEMATRQLVCLNNGNGARIDIHINTMSRLDLMLVSNNIATSAELRI